MALVTAYYSVNLTALSVTDLPLPDPEVEFENDAFRTLNGRTYEDLLSFSFPGTSFELLLGGKGIGLDSEAGITGTATGVGIFYGGQTQWTMEDFTFGVSRLYDAALSLSTNADPTLMPTLLAGNDRFELSKFNDTARGFGGNDVMYGRGGDDRLGGNVGNDKLYGGDGNDDLQGGGGRDVFVFNTALNAKTNVDVIRDFSTQYDKIQLDPTIFTRLTKAGDLNPSYFAANKAGRPVDSSDYIIYDTDHGKLYYDADGTGTKFKAVLIATFDNNPQLKASNFTVLHDMDLVA